jgi:hypothetical protein
MRRCPPEVPLTDEEIAQIVHTLAWVAFWLGAFGVAIWGLLWMLKHL